MIIVGSRYKEYGLKRQSKDIDIWIRNRETFDRSMFPENVRVEVKTVPDNVYNVMQRFAGVERLGKQITYFGLYNLKVSHIFWDINWSKHIKDIITLQKEFGYSSVDREVFDTLYSFWSNVHKDKKDRINLNKSSEEFFNNNVKREYKHDDIHNIIAYYDRPMFESLLKNSGKVILDKEKFDNLPYDDKLKLCSEEIYTIALERYCIPTNFMIDSLEAYRKALKKVVIDLSKGWFPLFIIENISTLMNPDIEYVTKFLNNKERLVKNA